MTPSPGDITPKLPRQANTYLNSQLDFITQQMHAKMAKYPDERAYWTTISLRCPRPKKMSRDTLSLTLEHHLCLKLEAAGFADVYINGVTETRNYHIRWHRAAEAMQEVA